MKFKYLKDNNYNFIYIMPLTIPTFYALRAVSIKNLNERIIFVKNFYKFKSLTFITTIGLNNYKFIKNNISK